MKVLLRHLLSIVLLPFTVTVLVPTWIARGYKVALARGGRRAPWRFRAWGLSSLDSASSLRPPP
jgi:hypothetical protein